MSEPANDNALPAWKLIEGEALAVLPTLPSDSVDAVITDPPYSSGGQFRGDRVQSTAAKYVIGDPKTQRPNFSGDNRDQRSFAYWCVLWLTQCLRIAKPGAPLLVFTDWRQLPTVTDAVQAAGWVWRGIIPWDKTEGCRPKMGGFRAQAEYAVWCTKGPINQEVAKTVGCLRIVKRPAFRVLPRTTGDPYNGGHSGSGGVPNPTLLDVLGKQLFAVDDNAIPYVYSAASRAWQRFDAETLITNGLTTSPIWTQTTQIQCPDSATAGSTHFYVWQQGGNCWGMILDDEGTVIRAAFQVGS